MKSLAAFMLVLTLLHSATISGTVYSYDYFEPLGNATISFHGHAEYQVFSKDGTYSIDLPPGDYNVSSLQYRNGSLGYMVRETLSVGSGNQAFDMVAFSPVFFENDELPELDADFSAGQPAQDYTLIYAALALAAGAIAVFLLWRRGKESGVAGNAQGMGDDEKDVLRILAENEGRMGQKGLRDILKYSESKMSLILTELEVTGRIRRFKKGRENIIKLKKGM